MFASPLLKLDELLRDFSLFLLLYSSMKQKLLRFLLSRLRFRWKKLINNEFREVRLFIAKLYLAVLIQQIPYSFFRLIIS